jgi:hypothetical protein
MESTFPEGREKGHGLFCRAAKQVNSALIVLWPNSASKHVPLMEDRDARVDR